MLTYGDGVSTSTLALCWHSTERSGKLATVTAVRPPAPIRRTELRGLTDTVRFIEKPQIGEGWVNGGFMVLEPAVVCRISKATRRASRPMCSRACRTKGSWAPTGTRASGSRWTPSGTSATCGRSGPRVRHRGRHGVDRDRDRPMAGTASARDRGRRPPGSIDDRGTGRSRCRRSSGSTGPGIESPAIGWPGVARGADGDVRDRAAVDRLLASERIDTVIHLAAQTLVGPALADPTGTFSDNIEGTWTVLEACRRPRSDRAGSWSHRPTRRTATGRAGPIARHGAPAGPSV